MSKQKFTLPAGTRMRIASINVRPENHGEEKVPCLDLGFEVDTSNDALAMFDSKLKAAIYAKAKPNGEPPEGQGELELPVSDLPALRFPDLAPLRFTLQLEGYAMTLALQDEDLLLTDCKVNKFSVECIEGGSVTMRFRVQRAGVDRDTYGALAMAYTLGVEVDGSLIPASEERQQDIERAATTPEAAFANAA